MNNLGERLQRFRLVEGWTKQVMANQSIIQTYSPRMWKGFVKQ